MINCLQKWIILILVTLLKTKYNTYKTELKDKIPDASDLVKKAN